MSQIIQKLHLLFKKIVLNLLLLTMFHWINKKNDSDAVWKWAYQKICNESNHTKIAFILKICSYLAVTNYVLLRLKKWMRVMRYEGDFIGNMSWVQSNKNCIQEKNKWSDLPDPDDVW